MKKSSFFASPKMQFILLVAIGLAGILIYPIGQAGSSVFYLSYAFFTVAIAFSSGGRGLIPGMSSLGLMPEMPRFPSLLLWGIAAFLVSCVITFGVSLILLFAGFLDSDVVGLKVKELPLAVWLLAFTLSPLGEEAFFRGILFWKVSGWAGKHFSTDRIWIAAALASSLIFSLFHLSYGSVAELIVAFLVGINLCIFTRKTGSLIPAVVAHAAFNFFSILYVAVFA